MICPGTQIDCDNPGCRSGGCQGRAPQPPLLRLLSDPQYGLATLAPAALTVPPARPDAKEMPRP